jgi:hypothetical protein
MMSVVAPHALNKYKAMARSFRKQQPEENQAFNEADALGDKKRIVN